MIAKIDKETVQFICKHRITFQQFALCLLIYHNDTASLIQIEEEIAHIGDCLIPTGKGDYKQEITDLIERGYLINNNKKNEYVLDLFVLTPKFTNDFLVDISQAPQEAWDKYPKNLLINNQEVTTKSCNYDEFVTMYLKAINWDIKQHKKALRDIELIKKQSKYAKVKIMNWAGGRLWNEREEEKTTKSKTV